MHHRSRLIQSGGRRIDFYAELGRYFTVDGQLDREAFRSFLHETLHSRLAKAEAQHADPKATETVGRWLSSHLEEVLLYLEERGLQEAALHLFETSLEESAALGIGAVSLSPELLRRTLASRQGVTENTERKRRGDPSAKRQRIFDAALAVFSERGFHNATMDEIAVASRVAKGTLYCYFRSKDDLLAELLRATSRELVKRFSEAFGEDGDILEQIETFIRSWLSFIEENHVLYRLIQIEGLSAPEGRQTMIYEYLLDDFPMAKERFAALNGSRALKTPNFHTAAYGVLGFIDGVARKWFRAGMTYPLQDEIPVILEVLFNGIVRESAKSRTFYAPPEEQ
ncbi:MAG TPA: TetR/AcrR family transcriptional regulator [Candidatus Hydrogenedentes bacterium]|nr:TetR/AcrR family transcriptional regulator [Candidatus Hydrogenedentota bacterium]